MKVLACVSKEGVVVGTIELPASDIGLMEHMVNHCVEAGGGVVVFDGPVALGDKVSIRAGSRSFWVDGPWDSVTFRIASTDAQVPTVAVWMDEAVATDSPLRYGLSPLIDAYHHYADVVALREAFERRYTGLQPKPVEPGLGKAGVDSVVVSMIRDECKAYAKRNVSTVYDLWKSANTPIGDGVAPGAMEWAQFVIALQWKYNVGAAKMDGIIAALANDDLEERAGKS